MRYPEGMTNLASFPVPLQAPVASEGQNSTYDWRYVKPFVQGREAFLKAGKANFFQDFLDLLDQNEWEPDDKQQPGLSLMAWRGWWSCVRWDTDPRVVQDMLSRVPALPASEDPLHWFASVRDRWSALDRLFSGERPPKPEAPSSVHEQHAETNAVRLAVLDRLTDRWPGLTALFLQSVRGRDHSVSFEEDRVEVYFHPLVTTARPGREKEFARLLAVDGLAPLLTPPPAAGEPGESVLRTRLVEASEPTYLLSVGLERGFEPLVQAALDAGASWESPFTEYKNRITLLHRLAGRQRLDLVERVLAQGASLEAFDSYGRTPFLTAARLSDVGLMQTLAAKGANVHARDRFGQTAVHLAVEGLRVADYDRNRSTMQKPVYNPRPPQQVQEAVDRLGLALGELRRLGVDMEAECLGPPKNSKKSPSPFAGLPTKRRGVNTAVAGQAWGDQIHARSLHDEHLPLYTSTAIRALLLEESLSRVIPPEPEEAPVLRRARF